jgi:hypothetical protein
MPPRKFTMARTERVYTAMIRFVELEVTGYRLSAKQVTIPNDLLIGNENEFTGRLRDKFNLLKVEQTVKDFKEYLGSRTEVFKPELSCIFKDVTNESIINEDLIKALGNALRKGGGKRLAELLLSKHIAAPETS